jgi:hypothetical protein
MAGRNLISLAPAKPQLDSFAATAQRPISLFSKQPGEVSCRRIPEVCGND